MLYAILKKEFLLVRRDIHALMVLFVMPVAFILIMSLSLQDTFQKNETDLPAVGFFLENTADKETPVVQLLSELSGFQLIAYENKNPEDVVIADKLVAAIQIPREFVNSLSGAAMAKEPVLLQVYYAPTTPESIRKILFTAINLKLAVYKAEMIVNAKPVEKNNSEKNLKIASWVQENELYSQQARQPSSVEQTVPAWLIFSMFFVVIPISTTFLIEKQHGTLQRLRTMPVPSVYFLIGKLIPYLCINVIQTLLMFMVGIFLLPMLGGQALHLSDNAILLLPMSLAVSVAAISFALLIATLVRTTEQATTIGGVSNLIFAAIGGVMVPTFVMPEVMQNLARFSPMNWGLEGYLTIILRQGNLADIMPEVAKLAVFAMVLFSLSIWFYRRTKIT